MTARLHSTQNVTQPRAWLNSGGKSGSPFAVINLNDLTYLIFSTPAEAYAMRDAAQRAGELLAGAEGAES